jgi:hypothetical protein
MQMLSRRRVFGLALAIAPLSSEPLVGTPSTLRTYTPGEECGCCSEYENEVSLTVHVVNGSSAKLRSGGGSCSGDVMVSCSHGSGCHSDEYVMNCLFSGVHSHSSSKTCDPPEQAYRAGLLVDILTLSPDLRAAASEAVKQWSGAVVHDSEVQTVRVLGCGGVVVASFPLGEKS